MTDALTIQGPATPAAEAGFVGRKAELELARRVLAESRLLTITGPHGVGKRRFAARVAEQMLRSLPEPHRRLDLREDPDPDLAPLREHAGIVVLEAGEDAAIARDVAARLLATCPSASVIATSTGPLGLEGEHLLGLDPFIVPARARTSSRAILDFDAIRLLVDRIRLVDPAFAPTTQDLPVLRDICAASDGLPAMIELAARSVRLLSLEAVREALRSHDSLVDLLPAAAQLRAAASGVVDGCDPVELRLLTMASVLRESVGLGCIASLLGEDEEPAEVVAAFSRLVDRSVLLPDPDSEGVFRQLRSVRRAARLRLDAEGRTAEAMSRVDAHLIDLMNTLADSPPGAAEVQLSRHLLEHRPSLERLLNRYTGDPESAGDSIRLIVRLRKRWSALGLAEQVQAWLEQAVKCRRQRDALTAEALRAEAYFSIVVRDFGRSAALLAESLEVAEDDDESSAMPVEFLQALIRLGDLDVDGAETELERLVERTRSSGRLEALDEQMYFLTLVNVIRGDHGRAEQLFRTSVDLMHARGNRWGVAHALIVRSISLLNRGLDERAGETAREAFLMMDSLGDRAGVPTCLRLLAALAHRHGDSAKAAKLLAAASRMHGSRTMARDVIGWGLESAVRASLGAREFSRLSARGRQLDRRSVVALALEDGASAGRPAELTRRESEIAELLVDGLSSAEIAARLVLSTRTVEGHIQRMLHKLQFRSRSQIALWMRERMDGGVRTLAS